MYPQSNAHSCALSEKRSKYSPGVQPSSQSAGVFSQRRYTSGTSSSISSGRRKRWRFSSIHLFKTSVNRASKSIMFMRIILLEAAQHMQGAFQSVCILRIEAHRIDALGW